MEPLGERELDAVVALLPEPPSLSAGGAAANTVAALGRAGAQVSFFGRLGDDEAGEFFLRRWREAGGGAAEFIRVPGRATARCLLLVTPDAERTMRSSLGVSLEYTPEEIAAVDFRRFDLLYAEGFMLYGSGCREAIAAAHAAGCRVALDLASFEIAGRFREEFFGMLRAGLIDFLFANREEAAALTGGNDPETALRAIARDAEYAAVKVGVDGAWIARRGEVFRVAARPVADPVDTTGAGDLWAAGFLTGWSRGEAPERAGEYGAIFSAEVVRHRGAEMDDAAWRRIASEIAALTKEKR